MCKIVELLTGAIIDNSLAAFLIKIKYAADTVGRTNHVQTKNVCLCFGCPI